MNRYNDHERLKKIKGFLREFFRDLDGYIEIRIIGRDGKVLQGFFDLFSLESPKFDRFILENLDKNIFFGVNPRVRKSGRSEDVQRGNTLWFDIDFHEEEKTKEEIIKEYEKFKVVLNEMGLPFPNFAVFTGKGFQVFWKLSEQMSIEELLMLEDELFDALSNVYENLDPKIKDAVRVMRLPFTFNVKYEKPIETDLIEKITIPVSKNAFLTVFKEKREEKKLIEASENDAPEEFNRKLPLKIRRDIVDFFKQFWLPGHRNQLQIALTATFLRNKVSQEHAEAIIKRICEEAGDEEIKARIKNVRYHYSKRLEKIDELKWKGLITDELFKIVTKADDELRESLWKIGKHLEDCPDLLKWRELYKSGDLLKSDIERFVKAKLYDWKLHYDFFKKEEIEGFTVQDLLALPDEAEEFYVDPLVPKGKVIIIGGRPESFKSIFAFYMSLCIASGKKFFEFSTSKARILYLDMENDKILMRKRLSYIVRGEKISINEIGNSFVWTPFKPQDYHKIVKIAEGFDIVIFDSFRRFLKGNESDSEVVNKFYEQVLKPLKDRGKTLILIHHFRKKRVEDLENEDIQEMFRGSSDIIASIDMAFAMQKTSEDIDKENKEAIYEVLVRKAKNRLGITIPDFSFRVVKNDKLKQTSFVFEGFRRVLTLEEKIKELITRFLSDGEPHKRSEIVEYVKQNLDVKVSEKTIDRALVSLVVHGTIEKGKKGVYMMPKKTLKLLGDEDVVEK